MLTAAVFALTVVQSGPALLCPITFEPQPAEGKIYQYAGTRTTFCCESCPAVFAQNPAQAYKAAGDKNHTVAQFYFDPVSGGKVYPARAKGSSDFGGVRFYFGTTADKKAFDADAKTYATVPVKEALFCPVENHPVASYASAGGYVDYQGVRYYVCCEDCLMEMNSNPGKYAKLAAKYIQAPQVISN